MSSGNGYQGLDAEAVPVADDDAASTSHWSRGFYRSLRRPRIWGVSFGVIIMAVCTVVALRVAIGFAINNEGNSALLLLWSSLDVLLLIIKGTPNFGSVMVS